MIQTLSTVMQLLTGPYFSVTWVLLQDIWPNSAIANGTTHVFQNSWVLFHLLQVFAPWETTWHCEYPTDPKAHVKMADIVNKVYWKKLVDKIITSAELEVLKHSRRSEMSQSFFLWDEIGYTKFVGIRLYSAIWRSERRISSRCLEISSISLLSEEEMTIFLASPGLVWPIRSDEALRCGISRLCYCDPR